MSVLLSLLGLSVGKLIAIVALGVAAGRIISKIALLTFDMFMNKIKHKLAKNNVSKVAAAEIGILIERCQNQTTIGELEELKKKGVTHFTAEVSDDGTVSQEGIEPWDVEKEETKVRDVINKTGEGVVVINS